MTLLFLLLLFCDMFARTYYMAKNRKFGTLPSKPTITWSWQATCQYFLAVQCVLTNVPQRYN
jgi:hypothetical protein